jgi:hypothetical protein
MSRLFFVICHLQETIVNCCMRKCTTRLCTYDMHTVVKLHCVDFHGGELRHHLCQNVLA